MTDKDKEKWYSRYLKDMGSSDPSLIQKEFSGLAPRGNALDISSVALDHLADREPNINVISQDMDTWELPQNHYEFVVNIRFLD